HFRTVQLAGQRCTYASSVVPHTAATDLLFARKDGDRASISNRPPDSPYLLALCADDSVDPLPASLFDVAGVSLGALEGGIAERDRTIQELKNDLRRRDEEL